MFGEGGIRRALTRLGELAWGAQRVIDIAVYGGSAIVLAWGFRVATKDVDAVVRGDPSFLRYMLAMKCMAMRVEGVEEAGDIEDIRRLIGITGMTTAEEVLSLVENFYPRSLIPPRVALGVEEILGAVQGAGI